jgi:hypothetical protein
MAKRLERHHIKKEEATIFAVENLRPWQDREGESAGDPE